MGNTIVYTDSGAEITFDGSTNWDSGSSSGLAKDAPNGLAIRSLRFIPTATDDILIVRDGSATARSIMSEKAATAYDAKSVYFNHKKAMSRRRKLFVKGSEATSGVKLIIEY